MAMLIITRGYTHTHIYILYTSPHHPPKWCHHCHPQRSKACRLAEQENFQLREQLAAMQAAVSPKKIQRLKLTNMFILLFYFTVLSVFLAGYIYIYICMICIYIYMHDMYIWICWRLYIHTILCIFALVNPPWLGNVLHFPLKQIESRKRTMTWICV